MLSRVLLIALVLSWLPVAAVHAEEQRVLLDMRVRMLPTEPTGQCFYAEAGAVTVDAVTSGENQWPIHFALSGTPNTSTPLLLVLGPDPVTATARIEAGVWCYRLMHLGGQRLDLPASQIPRWEQPVDLRLTWAPVPAA
jgi:hypothetical protein